MRTFADSLTSGSYRRLLEFAAAYYDVKTFPPGETRRALERVYNKKSGGGKNSGGYNSAAGGDDTREKKRRKKEKGSGR